MMTALLAVVIVATGLVILSGVWVAVALVAAVWRVDRSASTLHDRLDEKDAR